MAGTVTTVLVGTAAEGGGTSVEQAEPVQRQRREKEIEKGKSEKTKRG